MMHYSILKLVFSDVGNILIEVVANLYFRQKKQPPLP